MRLVINSLSTRIIILIISRIIEASRWFPNKSIGQWVSVKFYPDTELKRTQARSSTYQKHSNILSSITQAWQPLKKLVCWETKYLSSRRKSYSRGWLSSWNLKMRVTRDSQIKCNMPNKRWNGFSLRYLPLYKTILDWSSVFNSYF